MKKLNLFTRLPAWSAGLVAVLALFAAHSTAYAVYGDIRSIYPLTPEYTLDRPAHIGQTVSFGMRLLNHSYAAAQTNTFALYHLGAGSASLDYAMYQPAIGVWVSGKLKYAPIQSLLPSSGKWASQFTELVCAYTAEAGDFALPMHLANSDGAQVGASDSSATYYLSYENIFWKIGDKNYATNAVADNAATLSYGQQFISGLQEPAEIQDYDLNKANLNIKTLDFDGEYVDATGEPKIWRQVYQGLTATTTSLPGIVVPGGANSNAACTVYVWVEDTNQVTLAGADVGWYGSGTNAHLALPVTILAGTSNVTFSVMGVATSGTTRVFLSSEPTNRYVGSTSVMVTNFVTRTIQSIAAPDPYITAYLDTEGTQSARATAGTNYMSYASVLYVKLSKPYTNDVVVSLNPRLTGSTNVFYDGVGGDNILGISTLDTTWNGAVTSVKIPAGQLLGRVYVFALGANTASMDTGIQFSPSVGGDAANFFVGESRSCTLYVDDAKPVILQPNASSSFSVVGAASTDFTLKIADSYKDLHATSGWTVTWDRGDTTPATAYTGRTLTSGTVVMPITYSIAGTKSSTVTVTDENGNQASVTFPVTVSAPASVSATMSIISRGEPIVYGEGESTPITFHLSVSAAADVYAFLVPLSQNASNLTSSALFRTGVKIQSGNTNNTTYGGASLKFLDGNQDTELGGLEYGIVLRTGNSLGDPVVSGYASQNLSVLVTNVVPGVEEIDVNDTPLTDAGSTLEAQLALGVDNVFKVTSTEPSDFDKDGTNSAGRGFLTKWIFYDGRTVQALVVTGNPDVVSASYAFNNAGTNKVTVQFMDKDMTKYSSPFSFFVEVTDAPTVILAPSHLDGAYTEREVGGYVDVGLSAGADVPLDVVLTVTPGAGAASQNPGVCKLNTYLVRFPAHKTGGGANYRVLLADLDGTAESAISGWTITAAVTNGTQNSWGVAWSNYYSTVAQSITVENVAPQILSPADAGTNYLTIAKNTTKAWNWNINDITEDLTNNLDVTWTCSDGASDEFRGSVSTGTYSHVFTTEGKITMTLTVTDKDGGTATRTFYYMINPTKEIEITAFGPGVPATTDLSSHYGAAAGLGQGHVWADGARNELASFNLTSYYDVNKALATVYASGYRSSTNGAGAAVARYDDGTLNAHDIAIDPSGTSFAAGTTVVPADCYPYMSRYDSFFYCWGDGSTTAALDKNGTSSSGVADPATPAQPERSVKAALDAYEDNKTSYEPKVIFAVFAREFLATDNCGDINADAIPDLYVKKYTLSATNDLDDISEDNGDGDYLPSSGTPASQLIPGLTNSWATLGTPFSTRLEIRGYGDGLNDAPAQVGLGVTPAFGDFSALERRAYEDLTDAEKATWSPERPTDPTKEDTDGDGYSDGYEYYFWYHAHVGYIDKTGRHVYLTGHRYDPRDPAAGIVITPEEIATAFDPRVKADTRTAKTRDTDNDGLPDYLEYLIGTNPVEFDSDGDGLPDGWEVMTGTDPLTETTTPNIPDCDRNDDGDHMAISLETTMMLLGVPQADGTIAYFASPANLIATNVLTASGSVSGWSVTAVDGTVYLSAVEPAWCTNSFGTVVLRQNLDRTNTFYRIGSGPTNNVQGAPVRVGRGLSLASAPAAATWARWTFSGANLLATNPVSSRGYSAWKYGKDVGSLTNSFGFYVLGTEADISNGCYVCSYTNVAVGSIHYQVYQKYGFDPRTAWSSSSPLNNRTGGGPVWKPARTRPYANYDEFLVMSFFYNNGTLSEEAVTPTDTLPLSTIWGRYTTNPCGNTNSTATVGATGADTDQDGVPDGWELYVMAGPGKADGTFVQAGPRTAFSPFVEYADIASYTDDPADKDDLTERGEYSGTDSVAVYSNRCSTITSVNPAWLNKFWPTDPWNKDTDDDGIADGAEGKDRAFIYGSPVDDGKAACFAGGGLNPLSWDTDKDSLPDPWELQYAGSYSGSSVSNVVASTNTLGSATNATSSTSGGITNGMDGTVMDAWTTGSIDRDYDHDGLQNWQEYMTMAMRCWRYDDTWSIWGVHTVDFSDPQDMGRCLVSDVNHNPDKSTGENPNLVFGQFDFGLSYFSKCTNAWDLAAGQYYMFYDGVYHDLARPSIPFGKLLVNRFQWKIYLGISEGHISSVPFNLKDYCPTEYFGTSPLERDSDGDGMDDYYELFHGLDPLLGKSGVALAGSSTGVVPHDLIFEAYGGVKTGAVNGYGNYWMIYQPYAGQARGNGFDFELFPWVAGEATSDPDGDNIRNQEEAIMPNLEAVSTWHHTDPTPLWMTDASYSKSLTARYYLPLTRGKILSEFKLVQTGDSFAFSTLDAFQPGPVSWGVTNYLFGPFPAYDLNPAEAYNYNYSFEQNEGYDSDHDGIDDYSESRARLTTASDPQDSDDPRRRQAMYFNGTDAVLESRNPVLEASGAGPAIGEGTYLEYTVEAWAKAEDPKRPQTVVERTVASDQANPADANYLRRNFLLGINTNGYWYTKYDSKGTDAFKPVVVTGPCATTNWTHLAATYDGKVLSFYVNGALVAATASSVQPENGVVYVGTEDDTTVSSVTFYSLQALLVGAGAANDYAIDLLATVHIRYPATTDFNNRFKGFVDEVRVWDGARSASEIAANYMKRFTAGDAWTNRYEVYSAREKGATRALNEASVLGVTLPAELTLHYTFDHLFGAEAVGSVATTPAGFTYTGTDGRAYYSRPVGYACNWWRDLPIHSSVYTDYAWVPWIGDTVSHLERFDGTTADSLYWSRDFAGGVAATSLGFKKFDYPQTHEVQSLWTQMTYIPPKRVPNTRYLFVNGSSNGNLVELYLFQERNCLIDGNDLLPLGGAYPKYCSRMWDCDQPSTMWEQTGTDSDNDSLPDWWEQYVEVASKYAGETSGLGWDSLVMRNGIQMTAGEAYLRDLAAGATRTTPDGDSAFRQTADLDKDGLPDWWENIYSISSENARDDHDNDQLSNYAEYLVAEGFAPYGFPRVSPTLPATFGQAVPDYFLPVGSLYLGEMFADHDFMEDWWEDQYAGITFGSNLYTTRFLYDADKDYDGDGWSNYAECRYNMQCLPIAASEVTHYNAANELVKDYPIPTIALDVRYNGHQKIDSSSIVVQTTTDPSPLKAPEATWTASASNTASAAELYRDLGIWSDRHVVGTMTPGAISAQDIQLQSAFWSSSSKYTWYCANGSFVGSYDEFLRAQMLDSTVTLVTGTMAYGTLSGVTVTTDAEGLNAYLTLSGASSIRRLGTINLKTGAYDIDLGQLSDVSITEVLANGSVSSGNATNGSAYYSAQQGAFRLRYKANPSFGVPRTLYLGTADSGYVREGTNYITAFADMNGDGRWTAGEPYGCATPYGTEIGWRTANAALTLSDTDPSMMRVDLVGALAANTDESVRTFNDRDVNGSYYPNLTAQNIGSNENATVVHIRVNRSRINGLAYYGTTYLSTRLVDKTINLANHPDLTEADLLNDGELDLDWNTLGYDWTTFAKGTVDQITNAWYRIIVGNGTDDPKTNNNLVARAFVNAFELKRTECVPVAPVGGIVYAGCPTFSWTQTNSVKRYPAFRLRVYTSVGTPVYDSGTQRAPVANSDGVYSWTAPLYVGAPTALGVVFSTTNNYYWTVSMLDAKFTSSSTAEQHAAFRLNTSGDNGGQSDYGSLQVAVKYFGPATVSTNYAASAKRLIHVQAFTSPDFTGQPAGEGYVSNLTNLRTTNAVTVNAEIRGLPVGTYYVRAFIDSNGDLLRSRWESWGYSCYVGSTRKQVYDPQGYTIVQGANETLQASVFIEDTDIDQDGFPDAWEYDQNGDATLKTIGAASGNTFYTQVNTNLLATVKAFDLAEVTDFMTYALYGTTITDSDGDGVNDIAELILGTNPTVADNTATATSVTLNSVSTNGVSFTVASSSPARSVAAASGNRVYALSAAASTVYAWKLWYTASLDQPAWTVVDSGTLAVSGSDVSTEADSAAKSSASYNPDSGFYKVTIEKQ